MFLWENVVQTDGVVRNDGEQAGGAANSEESDAKIAALEKRCSELETDLATTVSGKESLAEQLAQTSARKAELEAGQ